MPDIMATYRCRGTMPATRRELRGFGEASGIAVDQSGFEQKGDLFARGAGFTFE